MKHASEGYPRPGDMPRNKLIALANQQITQGWTVYFKFNCAYCGERCTFQEKNRLPLHGECHRCHLITTVDCGGFLLMKEGRLGPIN